MDSMRDLITKLEDLVAVPNNGDGFLLEFSDKMLVETEITEINEDGDIVILGDDKLLYILENLNLIESSEAYKVAVRFTKGPMGAEQDEKWIVVDIPAAGVNQRIYPETVAKIVRNNKQTKELKADGYYDSGVSVAFKGDIDSAIKHLKSELSNDRLIQGLKWEYSRDLDKLEKAKANLYKDSNLNEAEYHGRKVPLGKPMKGDVKKSKVYVKNPKTGKVIKVNFGDKHMRIKKNLPGHRKSFRARHHCENPGPRTKARYWSCRAW
jgi:hypothetical protein